MSIQLYTFYRSLATWRVRIGLSLKGLSFDQIPVNLLASDQYAPSFRTLNPEATVPLLQIDGDALTQSIAILEYLEETRPNPAILPSDPLERALVRRFALIAAADAHPLIVPRVRQYLKKQLKLDEDAVTAWILHWMQRACAAMEELAMAKGLGPDDGKRRYLFGDTPGMAEAILVPQLYGTRNYGGDTSRYPILTKVETACMTLDAFALTHPRHAPDFPLS